MSIEIWLAFVSTAAVLLVIPGPTVLTIISYAIAQGRRATAPLVVAVALGDSTALAVSLLGLGTLLSTASLAFTILKWAGGLYLIYLGIELLRTGVSAAEPATSAPPDSHRRLFLNTYLVTALNPKSIVFFVAFLPQFIDPRVQATQQLWILAVTFVALAGVSAMLYAIFAGSARRLFDSPRTQQRFRIAGGALLTTAGVWALLVRRPA